MVKGNHGFMAIVTPQPSNLPSHVDGTGVSGSLCGGGGVDTYC